MGILPHKQCSVPSLDNGVFWKDFFFLMQDLEKAFDTALNRVDRSDLCHSYHFKTDDLGEI